VIALGFVSAILPDLSLEEVVRFASSEGFDCLEVSLSAQRGGGAANHCQELSVTAH